MLLLAVFASLQMTSWSMPQPQDDVELKSPVLESQDSDETPETSAEPEAESEPVKEDNGSTGLIVGIFFGMILTSVLVFVGLKRLDAIRRRREYRRMNDFLIDGMYNDA